MPIECIVDMLMHQTGRIYRQQRTILVPLNCSSVFVDDFRAFRHRVWLWASSAHIHTAKWSIGTIDRSAGDSSQRFVAHIGHHFEPTGATNRTCFHRSIQTVEISGFFLVSDQVWKHGFVESWLHSRTAGRESKIVDFIISKKVCPITLCDTPCGLGGNSSNGSSPRWEAGRRHRHSGEKGYRRYGQSDRK